ncbi:MAG: hypothetical protein ACO1OB_17620 [Archangium sp.]
MRRLWLSIGGAVVLSVLAVMSMMRPGPSLPRGWFRIPSGTVYFSDGDRGLCGYSSWEHYVAAGGTPNAWIELVELPVDHHDLGPCRRQDRADWLAPGYIEWNTEIWLSDGRSSVCDTGLRRPVALPTVAVRALPSGFSAAGKCSATRVAAGRYDFGNTRYVFDGHGHACITLERDRAAPAIFGIPADTQLEGYCPGTKLKSGWYRIPSGTVYLVDESNRACGYRSWEHFTNAGGTSGAWTQLEALPGNVEDVGPCTEAPPYDPGWYLIPPHQQPVWISETEMCRASWPQFFSNKGDFKTLLKAERSPKTKTLRKCDLKIRARDEAGWLAAGWFRIPTGTVYLSDGRGHVCGYASWEQYVASPARGDNTAWTNIAALPKGIVDDGVCPPLEIREL